jgi:phage shock protein PspC (stress-responsive transcriptional regulator)
MVDMNGVNGKRLERPLKGRWAAGVCAGIADYFDIDPVLIRVAFVVATFIGLVGIVAYLAGWALMPEQGESSSIVEKLVNKG